MRANSRSHHYGNATRHSPVRVPKQDFMSRKTDQGRSDHAGHQSSSSTADQRSSTSHEFSDSGSMLTDTVRSLTLTVSSNAKLTLWLIMLSACAAIAYTAANLNFKTDRADLIDPQAPFHKRWMNYTESFGDASDIVVVVEDAQPEVIKDVLDELGTRMTQDTDHFSNVLYKVEPGELRGKGLQYLSPRQLEAGLEHVEQHAPLLQGNWDQIQLAKVFARFQYELETGNAAGREQTLASAQQLATSMNRWLADQNDFVNPWTDLVPIDNRMKDAAQEVIYLMNDKGTMGFIKAFPTPADDDFEGATKSIDHLREMVAEVSTLFPSANISVTGIPVLENDEMRKSQEDMLKASVISFIGVGLLLLIGFRGFRHPMLCLVMLGVGMAWAFGYTTFAVGHLNILSVSFAAILIGLGIDFGIHYLARYLQLRHEGKKLQSALVSTSTGVGAGIMAAAITTALAFFCATFTSFLGVAELGIVAGGGILVCAAATFLLLPALISVSDENVEPRKLPHPFQGNLLRNFTSKYPKVVLIASTVMIAAISMQAISFKDSTPSMKVKYDYNLLNLQAQGLESVETQKRIFDNSDHSLLFAVSLAETPEEARLLKEQFEALPSVHHVEELATHIPNHPTEETALLVQAFRARLTHLPNNPPAPERVDPARIGRSMENFYLTLRRGNTPEARQILAILDQFLDRFEELSLQHQVAFMHGFEYRMRVALLEQFRGLHAASNTEPIKLADLPEELTSRFVSEKGKWLLQVYPKNQIWEIEPLTRFVNDVRSVDPDCTGTPLQNYEASHQIRASYEHAALFALAVIFLVLLIDFLGNQHKLITLLPPMIVVVGAIMYFRTKQIEFDPLYLVATYVGIAASIAAMLDFRNVRDTLFALVPPLVGGMFMLGMLAILKVNLNPANLIVLPLVLGIGVDDGVHVVHDFRTQKDGYRMSSSTINAIILTSFTSMIGFGSMMVASHQGLRSFGLTLVVGVAGCLFVSVVTLPALLRLAAGGEDAEEEGQTIRVPAGQPSAAPQQKAA